jgi:hypothetical protein
MRVAHGAHGALKGKGRKTQRKQLLKEDDAGIELKGMSVENPAYAEGAGNDGADSDNDDDDVLMPGARLSEEDSALRGGDMEAQLAALEADLKRTKAASSAYVAQRVAGVKQQLDAERAQVAKMKQQLEAVAGVKQQLDAERAQVVKMEQQLEAAEAKIAELERASA